MVVLPKNPQNDAEIKIILHSIGQNVFTEMDMRQMRLLIQLFSYLFEPRWFGVNLLMEFVDKLREVRPNG